MATELATRPPAFVDGKTLSGNDLRLNVLSGSGGATPLQSRGGVRPSGGSPGLVAALATPVMKVRVNAGIADVPSTSVTGGFYRVSWDQVDLDIDVSSAQARTDLIIVEVVDTGTSAATGKVRVLKGTSGAGRPSNLVVNAHWFSLAATAVRVSAESTGNIRPQDVTPEHPFAVAPGADIPVRTQAERDLLTKFPFLTVDRLDTGDIEMVNLSNNWVTVYDATPVVAPAPIHTTGNTTSRTDGIEESWFVLTIPDPGFPYRIEANAWVRLFVNSGTRSDVRLRAGAAGGSDAALPILTFSSGMSNDTTGLDLTLPTRTTSATITGAGRLVGFCQRVVGAGSWSITPAPSVYYRVVPA
jgi:hypothetical protein